MAGSVPVLCFAFLSQFSSPDRYTLIHFSHVFIQWTPYQGCFEFAMADDMSFLSKKIPLVRVFVPCIILCGICLEWDY